jgi:hypothetical protein
MALHPHEQGDCVPVCVREGSGGGGESAASGASCAAMHAAAIADRSPLCLPRAGALGNLSNPASPLAAPMRTVSSAVRIRKKFDPRCASVRMQFDGIGFLFTALLMVAIFTVGNLQ